MRGIGQPRNCHRAENVLQSREGSPKWSAMSAIDSKNGISHIFVVDDDEKTLKNIKKLLSDPGCEVSVFSNPLRALRALHRAPCDLLISDQRMPEMSGMELMSNVRRQSPDTDVILISGYATIDAAVTAVKQGAVHYLAKPFTPSQLRSGVREVLRKRRRALDSEKPDQAMIGSSAAMKTVREAVRHFSPLDCNVLVTGESGTGKELVARALHNHSPRKRGPFVACNTGAFSEGLIANELFGHEKEAFTGAETAQVGLLEAANMGTLLLDEVTDMPLSMQVKLLRVIQEREIVRVGGTQAIPLDVRIIAASPRNLRQAVYENTFREDLYYRLNVVHIEVPPLRDRTSDLPLLTHHFLKETCRQMGKSVAAIDDDAMAILKSYPFPGNVRELQNIIARGVAVAKSDAITLQDLPPDLLTLEVQRYEDLLEDGITLASLEKRYIARVLEQTGGAKRQAAQILGIDRTSLWRKLKKYDLDD